MNSLTDFEITDENADCGGGGITANSNDKCYVRIHVNETIPAGYSLLHGCCRGSGWNSANGGARSVGGACTITLYQCLYRRSPLLAEGQPCCQRDFWPQPERWAGVPMVEGEL